MWWLSAWMVAAAQEAPPEARPAGSLDGCSHTSVGRLSRVRGPAVVVLGERKGTHPDVGRARMIVRALAEREVVTLAVQAARASDQAVLDEWSSGPSPALETLRAALDWDQSWGFPYEPYARLFSLAAGNPLIKLVGIGAPYALPGREASVAVPPGYLEILSPPMGESPVPASLAPSYERFVAQADTSFAERALASWSHEGVLVVLVDRFHVEGGLGVQWQLDRLTEVPVHSALLADADSLCYAGDQIVSFWAL